MLDPPTLRVAWLTATTSRFRRGLRLDYLGRELEIWAAGPPQVMRTATTLYRAMDLRFWQEQAEAAKLA